MPRPTPCRWSTTRSILTRSVIVPVAGWYEWTGEPDGKHPKLVIRTKDRNTIPLTGMSSGHNRIGGMADMRDRRFFPTPGLAIITRT